MIACCSLGWQNRKPLEVQCARVGEPMRLASSTCAARQRNPAWFDQMRERPVGGADKVKLPSETNQSPSRERRRGYTTVPTNLENTAFGCSRVGLCLTPGKPRLLRGCLASIFHASIFLAGLIRTPYPQPLCVGMYRIS